MGNVAAGFSMSLDGFIAGPNDDVQRVFAWMFGGDTDLKVSIGEQELDLKLPSKSAEQYEAMTQAVDAWGGKHPMNAPVFVVTHRIPQEWVKPGSPFAFVTDGVESAVEQAKKVGGADIARQCLKAGLPDEIQIDLVPVLLGSGVRLFEQLGIEPVGLECTKVIAAPGVTHLGFCVVK